MNGWTSEFGSANFCSVDPCIGCPPGQCNAETGYCSCETYGDPAYPQCMNKDAIDCQGRWSDWTSCTSTCEKKRYFSIVTLPQGGGKTCAKKSGESETAKCQTGICCTTTPDQCLNASEFISTTCECRCRIGFQGTFCQTSGSTADRVVITEAVVDASQLGVFDTTPRPELEYAVAVANVATDAPPEETNMLYIYIGAGAAGLILVAGAAWWMMKKPAVVADPLLAGMEGLEGMDLTGMDLSALGLDATAVPM